jgi:hypothetical protein
MKKHLLFLLPVLSLPISASADTIHHMVAPDYIATPARPIPAAILKKGPAEFIYCAQLKIGEDGYPSDVEPAITSGDPEVDADSLADIRASRFQPATRDGVPFEIQVTVEIDTIIRGAKGERPTRPEDTCKWNLAKVRQGEAPRT